MLKIDEPLELSAPLAWRLAAQLCRRDAATSVDCSPGHATWQYLRMMGLIGSLEYRADFYRNAFSAVSSIETAPRILISGTADYGMFAQVLAAFRGRGIEPDITVVDLCETPLALNSWYAERMKCGIRTHCGDILDYTTESAYDVICTDSFVGRFPHDGWPALFAKWHNLLRPGGRLITVHRLRSANTPALVGFTAGEALEFAAKVLHLAIEMRDSLQVDPHTLAKQAGIYASTHCTYSIRSPADFQGPLDLAGFAEVDQTIATVAAAPSGVSGPSARAGGNFLITVAIRA